MFLCKTVIVNGRRTSVRLLRQTWMYINEICVNENTTLHYLCSRLDQERGRMGLSTAVRLFALTYYRDKCQAYKHQLDCLSLHQDKPHKVSSGHSGK